MRRSTVAFSLLEVIIGTLIFSAVFSGISAGWVHYERGVQKFRVRNLVRFVAQNKMEECLAFKFDGLNEALQRATNDDPEVSFVRKVDGQESLSTFTQEVKIFEIIDGKPKPIENIEEDDVRGDIKLVHVKVSYKDRGGATRAFELQTAVFRSE